MEPSYCSPATSDLRTYHHFFLMVVGRSVKMDRDHRKIRTWIFLVAVRHGYEVHTTFGGVCGFTKKLEQLAVFKKKNVFFGNDGG